MFAAWANRRQRNAALLLLFSVVIAALIGLSAWCESHDPSLVLACVFVPALLAVLAIVVLFVNSQYD